MPKMNSSIANQYENYYQSEENFGSLDYITSVIFYVIQCFLIFPTMYINVLVLRMLKRDKLSIRVELLVNSYANIVVSIMSIVNQGIIKFAFPACHYLGSWYCHLSTILMVVGMFRESVHSLTLSIYRYIFIVYLRKIQIYKVRVSWLIFSIKWFAVIIFALKVVVFNKDEFVMYFSRLCKGKIQLNSGDQPEGENITLLEFLEERLFYRVTKQDSTILITNFGNVNGKLAITLKAFCVIVDIFILAATLNIMEGFLYSRVAKFMKM